MNDAPSSPLPGAAASIKILDSIRGNWIAAQTGFSDDGSLIIVMPIWPDLVAEEACRRVRRSLSPTEVAEYLSGRDYAVTCEGLEQISE